MTEPAEMSVRELRADLADVINAASTRDQVTFVTSRGRRGLRGHRRAGREPEKGANVIRLPPTHPTYPDRSRR